jgi:hypothetical protein
MFGRKTQAQAVTPLISRKDLIEMIVDVVAITGIPFRDAMKQVAEVNGLKYKKDAFMFIAEAAIIHPSPGFRDEWWLVREEDDRYLELDPKDIEYYVGIGY